MPNDPAITLPTSIEAAGLKPRRLTNGFSTFAAKASAMVGSAWCFIAAIVVIVMWGAVGPHYKYSDTLQLIINTGTTIITFLLVFLIQNTQNRDAKAMHLK